MTEQVPWTQFRRMLIDEAELGFRLDVSRMGLSDAWLRDQEVAVGRALDAMDALERGAVANPDENRMVGHYWLRTPALAPTPELAHDIADTLDRIHRFSRDVHEGRVCPASGARFQHLLVVGIGGSALGPQLVADALGQLTDPLTVHFLDNTDPDGFDRVLDGLGARLANTLFVVISKSGGTPETRNGMMAVETACAARQLVFGRQAVAITQAGSALDRYAVAHGFLARFPMWDWVGGRTSVTSAVGLLPAALQGIDIAALLDGAATMDRATRRREWRRNPAVMMALAWLSASSGRGARDLVILPYKDRLALLSRYLQQLVMESLGKEKNLDGQVVHQGLSVYGNKGSTDQHAYVQQLRDGLDNFFATFIRVMADRAGVDAEVEPGITAGDYLHGFLLGTRRALQENGRTSLTLTIARLDARSLGAIIGLFERTVGIYAQLVGINAYHQPGVEAGKRAAAALLDVQRLVLESLRERAGRAATAEEVAGWLLEPHDVEEVFHILEHLAANEGRGVIRTSAGEDPTRATFAWAR
ncbi:MAG: glucose-6-phosphate isomerase [Vicinamibacterales bacterium]